MSTQSKGNAKSKHKNQILIIVILAGFVIASVSAIYYRYSYIVTQEKLHQYEVSYVIQESAVGDVLDTKNFSFAVTKVEFDTEGIKEFPAPPGMQFVMVSVSLHNKSGSDIQFFPQLETHLRDSAGTIYEISAAPKIEIPSIAGTIERSVAVNGQLGYMVPSTATDLVFVYEPKAFPNANTILYDIK